MDFKNYTLIEKSKINEIDSEYYRFKHNKSGAELIYLSNNDKNKVFSITFRTPPIDDSGLPHVLEHSVLCGSKNFPLKDPFNELLKGSMNTFLNAFTSADRTMYPVASQNDKDFINLMNVYLDAVLYPKIYDNPEILKQEGWRYDLPTKDDDLNITGIVYNEMKGAFSNPDQVLMSAIKKSLYPDNAYSNESGGDPAFIPTITNEKFLNFHKMYYHPMNSRIFIYGNGDIEKHLKFVDENYLSDFDQIEINSQIKEQKSFEEMLHLEKKYALPKNSDVNNKSYLSLNYVTGFATDAETNLAMEILDDILMGNPAAPLKKALLEANLGQDVYSMYYGSLFQPYLSIVVKNTNLDKYKEFEKITNDVLEKLSENIDEDLIEAALNQKEFELREADYGSFPKGLYYVYKAQNAWIYDADPKNYFAYEKPLNAIKNNYKKGYFENLIKKYFINNTHCSNVNLIPEEGLSEKINSELHKKLQDYKASLSDKEIEELVEDYKHMKEFQTTPNTKEELETIPLLQLEDIDMDVDKLPLSVSEKDNYTYLTHPQFTNNIGYFKMFFDVSHLDKEEIHYYNLLADIYSNIGTNKTSFEKLSRKININTGGIYFSTPSMDIFGQTEEYYPKLKVSSKAVYEKLPLMLDLIKEILLETNFDDQQRIFEILNRAKTNMEGHYISSGHSVAFTRLKSHFSEISAFNEYLDGIPYYNFVSNLLKNFSDKYSLILENLNRISAKLINKNHLYVSFSADEKELEKQEKAIENLVEALPNKKYEIVKKSFLINHKSEALIVPTKVQYVAKGYNYKKLGYDFDGSLLVLNSILSRDYLFGNVRVRGGAYGGFSSIARNGNIGYLSYRDPNLIETLNVYDKIPEFVESIDLDERELRKYIIGTISSLEQPLSPSQKADIAANNFMRKLTEEFRKKEKSEVLNTTFEQLKKHSEMIKKISENAEIAVVGSNEKIEENKDIFDNIIDVFN